MKALNNIRYILFAILILEYMANFAQNLSSYKWIAVFNGFLAIATFVIILVYILRIWKQKRTSLTLFGLFVLSIILWIISIFIFNAPDSIIGQIILWIMLGLFVIEIIWIIRENWKSAQSTNRFLAMENGGIFLLFLGYLWKNEHWAGASPMLFCSVLLLVILYLFKAFKGLFSEWKQGKILACLSFLFYIYLISSSIAYLTKIQHMPGSRIFNAFAPIFLLLVLIPILSNIKLKYGENEISFGKYLVKKSSPIFLFAFLSFISIVDYMQVMKVGPQMVSLYPSTFLKISQGTYNNGRIEPRILTYIKRDYSGTGKDTIIRIKSNDFELLGESYMANYNIFQNDWWTAYNKQ